LETFAVICLIGISIIVIPWAIRVQIKRNRCWRDLELKQYLEDLYKISCRYCNGTGYEGFTIDGEPTQFCEHCEGYGFVWRSICPPRWLKHGPIWRQSEIDSLKG